MVDDHHFRRVDTAELKNLIYQKIGRHRADTYFHHLKKFIALKLSKSDFDRTCISLLGKANIHLHNRLICGILRNSCHQKIVPPEKPPRKAAEVPNGYQRSCFQSLYGTDGLPSSPRKARSPVHREQQQQQQRKFREKPSPLGPLGKSPSLTTYEETLSRIQEQSAAELRLEEGEEVEQFPEVSERWRSVPPPLGVSRSESKPRNDDHGCQRSGELPDSASLRSRMETKLAAEGMVGVSLESADALNKGLNAFLKRLLGKCPMTGRICMVDLRVGAEANPRVLGENWGVVMERMGEESFL